MVRPTGNQSIEEQILIEVKKVIKDIGGDSILRIVLYGSRARGDYDAISDIDVAVIVRGLTRELKTKLLDAVAEVELRYLAPLSMLVLDEKDFEFLKKRERRIALDIEKEGILL